MELNPGKHKSRRRKCETPEPGASSHQLGWKYSTTNIQYVINIKKDKVKLKCDMDVSNRNDTGFGGEKEKNELKKRNE